MHLQIPKSGMYYYFPNFQTCRCQHSRHSNYLWFLPIKLIRQQITKMNFLVHHRTEWSRRSCRRFQRWLQALIELDCFVMLLLLLTNFHWFFELPILKIIWQTAEIRIHDRYLVPFERCFSSRVGIELDFFLLNWIIEVFSISQLVTRSEFDIVIKETCVKQWRSH